MGYSSCKQTARSLNLPKSSCERDTTLAEDILHSTTLDKLEEVKGQARTSQSLAIVAIEMFRLKKSSNSLRQLVQEWLREKEKEHSMFSSGGLDSTPERVGPWAPQVLRQHSHASPLLLGLSLPF